MSVGVVLTLGESMALVRLAGRGSASVGFGGAESNVAIGLAHLGQPARWLGRLGDDEFGRMISGQLAGEGVDVRTIVDRERQTGLMVKHPRGADDIEVRYYRAGSAGSALCPEDLDAELWDGVVALHVTGITPALSAAAARTVLAAIDQARGRGALVSFDLNYRARLWARSAAAPVLHTLVEGSDIVFAGPDEARLVLGEAVVGELDAASSGELAVLLAALGPREVLVKDGPRGCAAFVDGRVVELPAEPTTVVDTVGAGDAFAAGYLAERLAGAPVEARLRTALLCGARACATEGDWETAPPAPLDSRAEDNRWRADRAAGSAGLPERGPGAQRAAGGG